jgi:DNA-binding MarR family transcriptional regulator
MDDTNETNEGFGIWVPAEIVQDKEMTLAEKFCFGVICALDKGRGFWMKNETLAGLVGISPTYASVCISKLKDKGLVTIEQVPGGRRTVICVDRKAIREALNNTTSPGCENHKAPLVEIARPTHNTRDDRTRVIKQAVQAQLFALSPECPWTNTGLFDKAWQEWVAYRKQIKAALSDASTKKQMAFISANSKNEQEAVQMIENSIRNGWRGLFPLTGMSQGIAKQHPSNRINYKEDGLT